MLLNTKYDCAKHAKNLLEEKFCFGCEYYIDYFPSTNMNRFKCDYHNILKEEDPKTTSCDHWKKDDTMRGRSPYA